LIVKLKEMDAAFLPMEKVVDEFLAKRPRTEISR